MPLLPPQVLDPIFGTLISFADWVQLLNFVLQTTGYCTAFQQGEQNALPLIQPLALTADGVTMNLTFGGTSGSPQFVLVDGTLCASVAQQTIVVAANAGSTRTDKIWINTALTQVGTVPREVEDTMGNKTPSVPIPVVISGLQNAWYDQGGTNPPAGSGWVEFATVSVPNGATSINNGEITILLPNMNPSGAAGSNAYSTTTGGVVIPAISSTVTVPVVNATPFPIGDYVIVSDGTHAMIGLVTNVSSLNLTVQNVAVTEGSIGNTISTGATIAPSGVPGTPGGTGPAGTPGAPGSAGHGSTTTTTNESIPNVGSAGVLAVADGTAFPNGTYGIASDGTHAYIFEVTSGGGTTSLVTQCTNIVLGAAGNTIASGATVSFSGVTSPIGSTFCAFAAQSSVSVGSLSASLIIPSVGAGYSVLVEMDVVGVVGGGGAMPNAAASGGSLTSAALGEIFGSSSTWEGPTWIGTAAPGTTINASLTFTSANFDGRIKITAVRTS